MRFSNNNSRLRAFSLIEMLIVISVIGVMAALIISAYTNVSRDAENVVARQQQAALQTAVNNWVAGNSATQTISELRTSYNGATTSMARLMLVKDYLDDATFDHLDDTTIGNEQLLTSASKRSSRYFQLSDWASGSYPKVEMLP